MRRWAIAPSERPASQVPGVCWAIGWRVTSRHRQWHGHLRRQSARRHCHARDSRGTSRSATDERHGRRDISLEVDAEDANSNTDPTYNGPLTVSLSNNPGEVHFSGTVTLNAVNGVALFTAWRIATWQWIYPKRRARAWSRRKKSFLVTPAEYRLAADRNAGFRRRDRLEQHLPRRSNRRQRKRRRYTSQRARRS